jgi:hypothetical protein
MTDTIVLALDRSQFSLSSEFYDSFSPSARGLYQFPYIRLGSRNHITLTANPIRECLERGEYMPRLRLVKAVGNGGFRITLYIEFSAPKMLFNNNFEEVTDEMFDDLCEALESKLVLYYGILINDTSTLKNAPVCKIHYGKNLIYTDGTLARTVIRDYAKANVPLYKRADTRVYKNGGESTHFYTKKWGLAIYDKMRELERSLLTGDDLMEEDHYCQQSLVILKELMRPFEVVRIEARYLSRGKICKCLQEAGVKTSAIPTFAELFKAEIARKALLYEIRLIQQVYPRVTDGKDDPFDFAVDVRFNNPNIHAKTIMETVGFRALVESAGARDVRLNLNFSTSQWSNLMDRMNALNVTRRRINWVDATAKAVAEFHPVDTEKLLKTMEK